MQIHKYAALAAVGVGLALGPRGASAQPEKPAGSEKQAPPPQASSPAPAASPAPKPKPAARPAKPRPAAAKPANAGPPKTAAEWGRRFRANKTVLHYSPQHGTQIEYHTADGRAFLWYPGNPIILPGQWRVEEVPNVPKLWEEPPGSGNIVERTLFQPCYRYGPNTYNPVTRNTGDKWECSGFFTGFGEARDGDLFRLARGGPVPFPLMKRRYTYDELLAAVKAAAAGERLKRADRNLWNYGARAKKPYITNSAWLGGGMSEVTALVMPILQKIQADLADMKRVQAEHTEKFEEIEIYLAYATGLASQNKADVRSVKSEIRTIKQRLEALELRP
jgi:hypothetical protein